MENRHLNNAIGGKPLNNCSMNYWHMTPLESLNQIELRDGEHVTLSECLNLPNLSKPTQICPNLQNLQKS